MAAGHEEDLKDRVLGVLREERGLTFSEIANALSWSGDMRPLRRALGDLVREGRVLREPDYQRKRMTFRRAAPSQGP